jgi:hypothetical protein
MTGGRPVRIASAVLARCHSAMLAIKLPDRASDFAFGFV